MPCSDLCWVQGAQPCPYCSARAHTRTCMMRRSRFSPTHTHQTCRGYMATAHAIPSHAYIYVCIYVLPKIGANKKSGRCAGLTIDRSTAAEAGRSWPRGPPSQGRKLSPLPIARSQPCLKTQKEKRTADYGDRPTTNTKAALN